MSRKEWNEKNKKLARELKDIKSLSKKYPKNKELKSAEFHAFHELRSSEDAFRETFIYKKKTKRRGKK